MNPMIFDFSALLVLGAAVTGLIWAADAVFWAPRRRALATGTEGIAADVDEAGRRPAEPVVVEYARAFFPVIFIVLLLRSFIAEPFRIPSASMVPTLVVGDFILVNKFAYGIRLPVLNTKVVEIGAPRRGDVVVFRFPNRPSEDYIKRIIGLPGDRITYRNKTLYVNGERIDAEYLGVYTGRDAPGARLYEEYLGGVAHRILIMDTHAGPEGEWIVPEGHYFAMGDNRDNSHDSRSWGFVPEENLVGKAFFIWMSWRSIGSLPAWDRIGTSVD